MLKPAPVSSFAVKVVEEIAPIGVQTHFGAFHTLLAGVVHVLSSRASNLWEENLVQVVVVDGQMGTALCASLSGSIKSGIKGMYLR